MVYASAASLQALHGACLSYFLVCHSFWQMKLFMNGTHMAQLAGAVHAHYTASVPCMYSASKLDAA